MADEVTWDNSVKRTIDSSCCLRWQPFENFFSFSHEQKVIHFQKSDTKVAIGEEPLDFSSNFRIEFGVRINGQPIFRRAYLIGISDQPLHGNGYPVLLGSTKKSWGWSVEGKLNHSKKLVPYSPIWEEVSNEKNFFIVQMEYSANEREIRFCDNGVDRGVAFKLTKEDISQPLYPAVSFASSGHKAIMKRDDVVNVKPAKR